MGSSTRKTKELNRQPEIVVNSLLYFVKNAMVGDCHQDPKLTEEEITQNSRWIIDKIGDFIYTDEDNGVSHENEVESAFEVLSDNSKPWYSPLMAPLMNMHIRSYHNLITSIIKCIAIVAKSKTCAVRFATVDRNFPSFEDFDDPTPKCTTQDQVAQTEPSNCTRQDMVTQTDVPHELPEDRVITGKDFNVILNEIIALKAHVISSNRPQRKPYTPKLISHALPAVDHALPGPISDETAAPTPIPAPGSSNVPNPKSAGEILWTQVVKKKILRKVPSKATIGSCDSSHLAASKTRPASLFISRLSPSTSAEDIRKYITRLSFTPTQIVKLGTKFETYSSYHVVFDIGNKTMKDVLQPSLWPGGVLVRRFYEPIPH